MDPNRSNPGPPTGENQPERRATSDASEATGSTFHGANHENRTIIESDVSGPAEAKLEAGSHIGKYAVRSLLGEGGMGAVYLAFDPLIERDVAIKVLSPKSASIRRRSSVFWERHGRSAV